MKILFICDTMRSGGAEKVIATLSDGFVLRDNNVLILMISHDAEDSFYNLNKKVELFKLDSKNIIFLRKANKIKRFVLEKKPDIVISFLSHVCIYTWWALKNTNIPYIVSERNNPAQRNKIKQFLVNFSFKKANGCVFQTKDAFEWYKPIIGSKGVVISNPVCLTTNSRWIDQKNKKQEITMVGSKKREKNRMLAYRAFAIFLDKHPSYILRIFGETTEAEDSEVLIELGIKNSVKFEGIVNCWHEYAIQSELFILTSDFEGMPNALLEAASLQIPCISTNCPIGGPKEILENGKKGILIPVGDYNALASKMTKIINSKDLQIYFAKENTNTADQYNSETIVNKWIEFIEGILKNGKNRFKQN